MSTTAPNLILGTAGHIDHGKTSIVKALTGVDTDWLPEEKARGMTIDIGIAHLDIGDRTVGLVDVPGHERFVRTMVAGASGIDVALLVVAADDGVMPQTIEHFEIVGLLGVERGVVAINKVDIVDPDRVEEVKAQVRNLLATTPLADAPMIPVSAITGQGVDELKGALADAIEQADLGRRSSFFRLPIDRIFSIPGRGTVVTGSMLGGTIQVGDQVELLPQARELRVRGLQAHRADAEGLGSGQRTAVNLAGIKKEEIHRGMELAAPGYLQPATFIDAEVRCLASITKGLNAFVRVRMAIGTSEVIGRLVLLERSHLGPGETALAQLRLYEPIVGEFGQRFILRDETASRTVGGGRILRPSARRIPQSRAPREIVKLTRLRDGDAATRVTQAVADAGVDSVDPRALAARTRVALDDVTRSLTTLEAEGTLVHVAELDRPIHVEAFETLGERILRFMKRFHRQNPQVVGIEGAVLQRTFARSTPAPLVAETLRRLEAENKLTAKLQHLALATHQTQMSEGRRKLWDRVRAALQEGGFKPPSEAQIAEKIGGRRQAVHELLQLAESQGTAVKVDEGLYYPIETIDALKGKVRELYTDLGPFTVSVFREYIGSSRKYVVPLCEYFDRSGFTERDGDFRKVVE